jgi:hypothetical protein
MILEDWMYITDEDIEKLIDGEYYWIAYEFPSDEDETWGIGIYNKKFNQFDLCNRITITPNYIIEVQKVEPPH